MIGANGQEVELLTIGGRQVEVDAPIAPIVAALNEAGVATKASCSGHGFRPGNIALTDGREIIIARDYAEARRIDGLFPLDINGNERRVFVQQPRQQGKTQAAARERVRKVAEGATINGTYRMLPGEALEAFRADLLRVLAG